MQELNDKMKKNVSRAELTEILQCLALRLAEKSVGQDGAETCLLDFKSIELAVKKKDEGYKLKLKIKRVKPAAAAPEGEAGPEGKEGSGEDDDDEEEGGEEGEGGLADEEMDVDDLYEILKKSMKKSWNAITKSAAKDQLPPEKTVRAFLRDGASMVTFKGFGDECYPEFIESLDALLGAFESGEIAAFQTAAATVKERMETCHVRFKK